MVQKRLVVIGGVAAGMSAASKARRRDKELQIEVYTDENYVSYAGCGLPYYIQGLIEEEQSLVARTKEQFNKQGIDVYMGHRALAINPSDKTIVVLDATNNEIVVSYDKLVIATGARAAVPSFAMGKHWNNLFTVTTIPSSRQIKELMEARKVKDAVVIGGGYIGLEMAEALAAYHVDVTLVQRPNQLLRSMDEDMAQLVEEHLLSHKVKVRTGENVKALGGRETINKVITDKNEYPADLVILAVGVQPNSEIARDAGIELGVKNAIKVNRYMETNLPDIYAAGDCAVGYHLLYEKDAYIPLGTTANKQGKIAGENAAGGKARFAGIIGTTIIKVMDIEIGRAGLSMREAEMLGTEVVTIKVDSRTKAGYYPGAEPITVKLLIAQDNHKVVGAQLVGGAGAGKRIDVLATAVQLGLTPYQLAELDLSYAPPFSPVWDPVLVAANVAVAKLDKGKLPSPGFNTSTH